MTLAAWLQQEWYAQRRPSPALWLLLPLHALFVLISAGRRLAYRCGMLASIRLPVPVIVVGNLVAGGVGKTPLVLWLVKELQRRGRRPGIVSRGYGGTAESIRAVPPDSPVAEVGDEPLMLARRSGVPVWIGADRAAAGQALLATHAEVDILIADDGLQHYRLARDAEVVVFDGRGAGNGWRLPIGPLREPLCRLRQATALVFNGGASERVQAAAPAVPRFDMNLQAGIFYRLGDPTCFCSVEAMKGKKLHALAGIGAPSRFFGTLKSLGLQFAEHPFPDHHVFTASDLDFGSESVLLMTEKDAVKCTGLTSCEAWVLPVIAQLPPQLADFLLEKIDGRQIA